MVSPYVESMERLRQTIGKPRWDRIAPECVHCYAEVWAKRNPAIFGKWGKNAVRVIGVESYWKLPYAWNRAAESEGVRRRVFCASLADIFEDRADLIEPRKRVFEVIDATHWLDWLLLTKRPENIEALYPENENIACDNEDMPIHIHIGGRGYTVCEGLENDCCWGHGGLPVAPCPLPSKRYRPNVWLGTSCGSSQSIWRVNKLCKSYRFARRLFVSAEPLLEPIDIFSWLCPDDEDDHENTPTGGISWVIVGGESGPKARECEIGWIRSIVDQCGDAFTVPVFVKQDSGPKSDMQGRIPDDLWIMKEFPPVDR